MKRFVAIALVIAAVTLPVCAQRGGGSRGGSAGRGGGFSSHTTAGYSAPAFRTSFPSVGRTNFMAAPQFSGSRYGMPSLSSTGRSPVAGNPNRRPIRAGEDRSRRSYAPRYGVGLPYSVGFFPDFLDYPENGGSPDSAYVSPQPAVYPAAPYDTASVEQAPQAAFRPAYARPQPEPEPEDAVTLVFKDGRPDEQIRNYMLTRTTLYVQEKRLREIPVDLLDLAATEKVNHDAGIDFQLPGTLR